MAGLLTFPQSALPSQPCSRSVTFSKQTLCLRGLQLQVQFRTLTGFPCIEMVLNHPITINFGAKVQQFPQSPTNPQKYSKIKKKKAPRLIEKQYFQCLNWKRDPVGTFVRYFKSRKESLKYCDLVIYERLLSRNNRLKPLLYHRKGVHCIPPQKIRRCLSSKREVT